MDKLCNVCDDQVFDMKAMKANQILSMVHSGCTVFDKNTGIVFLLLSCFGICSITQVTDNLFNHCSISTVLVSGMGCDISRRSTLGAVSALMRYIS